MGRRPRECSKCGARVSGSFCAACGTAHSRAEIIRARLVLDLDVEMHRELKAYCAKNRTTVREVLLPKIQLLLKGGKKSGERKDSG
jgi:hypothetical protein